MNYVLTRHRHADLIIEWAETGCDIEYRRSKTHPWTKIGFSGDSPSWNPEFEYQKCPRILCFRIRRYLTIVDNDDGKKEYQIRSIQISKSHTEEMKDMLLIGEFIKWLDEDWEDIYVEV